MHKNPAYFVPYLIHLLQENGQTCSYDGSQVKRATKVVNVTKQNILDDDDITHVELMELLNKQESNSASTEEKYQIERYYQKTR
jgi:hypothetical protein